MLSLTSFLFLNLQIACVIVPIGQKAHHVLGLKKIITIRPIRSDVRHQAVKSEAELCHPIREYTPRICPSPRNTECPKQFDCFTQIFRTACHKVGLKNHIAEHGKEKYQKTISKPFGCHPFRCWLVSGAFEISAQLTIELPSAAKVVAEKLVTAKCSEYERQQKINHTEPSKQNIEKPECKICNGPYP